MESGIQNLDLFSVGLAIAAIGILGFVIFFSNRSSITNRTFLYFAISGILWAIFNYAYNQVTNVDLILIFLRFHAFFAVWYAFFIFQLFCVFPNEKFRFSALYSWALLPMTLATSLLTLSPYVFAKISGLSSSGHINSVINGPGIFLFGGLIVGLVCGGPIILWRRRSLSTDLEKRQFSFVLIGSLLTFGLHIIFNFLLPAFFNDPRFVSLGGVFIIPFVVFTAYAIFKHHLLNIKVITTEVLTFVLAVVSFFEVVIADNPLILIFRSGILVLILSFGVLLIKSVRKEVEQREKLEQLNKELEEAKLKLEELSRFKTQLLSLASHQIKSPLAAIKGFISIMLQGLYGPIEPKIKETLEKMKHSSDELIDLINSVLDLRKVEEGKMEYSFERVSLTSMVKGVVEEIQPLASGKGLKLEAVLPANEIFVQADKTKLKQVIQNLIDNSIKYTLEGFVRAELKEEDAPEGKSVVFSVNDSGLGMSPELLPHLFSEFVRDERVKKEIRGTGFGLYIAKGIIEAHGGKIWAESPGEGKGSTFAVRLREV